MRKMLLLLGMLFGGIRLWGQAPPCDGRLMVRVVDSLIGQGISHAWIEVEGNDSLLLTEEDGYVMWDGICLPRPLRLQVFASGYTPVGLEPSLSSWQDTLVIALSRWGEHLEEITIHAHHRPGNYSSPPGLGEKAIAARFGLSLARISGEIPGLQTTDHGMTLSKPVVHGLSGSRVQILADEMSLEDQSWGSEHAPMADPSRAARIQLVEGALSLKYGAGAAGRVIQLEPQPLLRQPGMEFQIRTMAMSNGRGGAGSLAYAGASRKIPGLAWRGEARSQASGNYKIPGYYVANSAARESSFSGRLGYSRNRGQGEVYFSHMQSRWGLYSGSHTGSSSDLLLAIASPYPRVQEGFRYEVGRPYQQVGHSRAGILVHWDIPSGAVDFRYGFQANLREEYEPQRAVGDQAQLHLKLHTHQMNLDWEHDWGDKFHGHWGLDISHSRNRFRDGDRFLIPAYDGKKAALYFIESLEVGRWEGEAGLRWEFQRFEVYQPEGPGQHIHYHEDDYSGPALALGLARRWNRQWESRWQFHSSWRPPQVAERFSRGLHQGAARMEFGNPLLETERVQSISWDQSRYWNGGKARLRLYGQSFQGFIYPEPGEPVLSIRGSFRSYRYDQVPVHLWGAEFNLDQKVASFWNLELQASLIRARDRHRQDWLLGMPADQYRLIQRFHLPWPAHSLFELEVRGVGEQNRLPRDFESRDYLRPPGAYTLVSARWTWAFSTKADWELSLEMDNLTNLRYRDYLDAFRYYLDRPGRNLIFRLSYGLRSGQEQGGMIGQ